MRTHHNRYSYVWVIAILAMTHVSHAQIIPGKWHKVALPQPVRMASDNTMDFSFKDSLNGICLSDKGLLSSTSNGGRSWELDTDLNGFFFYNKVNLNSIECTAPHHGFMHGMAKSVVITPGGTYLQSIPRINEVNYYGYLTLAEKMYDTAYGFRLAEWVNQGQFDDSVAIIVTHDGWESSVMYGSAYVLSPNNVFNEQIFNGYIVDSNDVWTAKGYVFHHPTTLLHTSNGGATWDSIGAIQDSLKAYSEDFFVNSKTHEVFFSGTFGNYSEAVDYAYSSDYGKTWRLDSTFGRTLWRLANPAPGVLWAMISQGGDGFSEVAPGIDTHHGGKPLNYSRKLAYSSDNGKTWLIDSTTFIDDSLEELHFLDARHGWVASWSHDSLFMWCYDADGTNGVVEHRGILYSGMPAVYPNPVTETISLNAPGQTGRVSVFDVLGREVRRTSVPPSGLVQIDAATLLPGAYYILVGSSRSRFVKE